MQDVDNMVAQATRLESPSSHGMTAGMGSSTIPDDINENVTLHDIFRANEEVWVSFPGIRGQPAGNFVLNFPGNVVKVPPIPVGQDPINLSARVHNRFLEQCQDLYMAISGGRLVLWHPERARRYMQERPERVNAMDDRIKELMDESRNVDPELKAKFSKGQATDYVNPRVAFECLKVRETPGEESVKEKLARAALQKFIPMQELLKEADLEYMVSNGGHFLVCKWARDLLDGRRRDAVEAQRVSNQQTHEVMEDYMTDDDVRPDNRTAAPSTAGMPSEPTEKKAKQATSEEVAQAEAAGPQGFEDKLAAAREKAIQEKMG